MTDDPQPLDADALPGPLRERLAKMPPEPFHPDRARHGETPQEKADRLEARRQVYATRWAAQVPAMFQDADVRHLDAAQAFTWPDGSLNLVLAGPVGTGKTYAAYAIGNALVAGGGWVSATTVVDLLAALRPDGNPNHGRAAQECQVLILDDLGATKASEWAVEQMTALMDVRIREGRRTIVTTNVPEPDLEAAWGGRFMDRLRFRRTVVVFRGESRRKAEW